MIDFRLMPGLRRWLLSCAAVLGCTPGLWADETHDDSESRLRADVSYLANDAREGRGIGSDGLYQAGEMIAARFAELGLQTELFDGSPFQQFTIPDGHQLAADDGDQPPGNNWLRLESQSESREFELGVDWMPLSLGSSGSFRGELVFAGYGISAPNLDYDDYAGLDVTGKVVIVLRKHPLQGTQPGRFSSGLSTRHAYFSTKQTNAANRGAAAMIIVNDRLTSASSAGDQLFSLADGGRATGSKTIPTMHVLRSAIEPLIQRCTGKSLLEWELEIDDTLQPASQPLGDWTAAGAIRIEPRQTPVRNVIALLPGAGQLADQFVILGAHYDHIGWGGVGSLAPGTVAIHNGADDNASGTAAMLEAARQLSQTAPDSRRSILFMAFTAEERGLLGSRHYVKHPLFPLEQAVAMINLDMVGRMHDGALIAYGTGTAVEFGQWLNELSLPLGIEISPQAAGFGPSDHQSFHEAGLPVLHLFTGMHNQYHRPSDDVELIDFPGLTRVAELTARLVERLATQPLAPTPLINRTRAKISTNPGWRRAVLGITMDASASNCLVSSVNPDSAAMQAGLQPGDVIIKVDEHEIATSQDLINVMGRYRAGDQVTVVYLRGDQPLESRIGLGS